MTRLTPAQRRALTALAGGGATLDALAFGGVKRATLDGLCRAGLASSRTSILAS